MSNVVDLIPAEPEGVGIVEAMEHHLQKAKDGEYSAMTLVWVDREGCSGSFHTELHSVSAMVGSMERAKHRIIMEADFND